MTNNEQLQAFFLYCQAVEAAYHDWKQYWLNYYMNKGKDLYDPSDFNMVWLKNQKSDLNS